MCGIAGFQGKFEPPSAVRSILRHRGPDAYGEYLTRDISLYHWRLSVLDLTEAGNQPMENEDGRLRLIFNGEIYNFKELRQELQKKGHRFKSRTDGEVILHLYEEEGPDCLKKLRGMFAFALWDGVRQELLLARDPFGIKPLLYAETPQGFAFASEGRFFNHLNGFSTEIDQDALTFYFRFGYIPAPWSIWENVRKVLPGHFLIIQAGRIIQEKTYYHLESRTIIPASERQTIDSLEECLRQSVALHLQSDVPLGVFFSGGMDSTIVAAMAQKESNQTVNTFTVTFPDTPVYNEASYAKERAAYLETRHFEIPITAEDSRTVMEETLDHLDEPFSDSSLIPAAIVSKFARNQIKVALGGDGGDEFFGGYDKYQALRLATTFKHFPWLFKLAARLPFAERRESYLGNRVRQFRKLSAMMTPDFSDQIIASMEVYKEKDYRNLGFSESQPLLRETVQGYVSQMSAAQSSLEKMMSFDSRFVLPYDMLTKIDIASSRYSLEVRVPFVDKEIAKFAMALPCEAKFRGRQQKWILQQVLKKYLPAKLLNRPKWGFGIPFGHWMRHQDFMDKIRTVILEDAFLQRFGIHKPFVLKMMQEHVAQQHDWFWQIWSLYVLGRWHRNVLSFKTQ